MHDLRPFIGAVAVRAASTDFAVDGVEVSAARWFDKRALLQHWEAAGGAAAGTTESYRMAIPTLPDSDGRTTVSTWAMCCLQSLEEGEGMPVRRAGRAGLHFNSPGPQGLTTPSAKL
jgi:hypothetical protein